MNIDNQIVYKMIEDICPFYKDGMCNANLPFKPYECRHNCGSAIIGTVVYRKGYRKASDVAEDIIRILRAAGINEHRYPVIAEIKKKYIGEDTNVTTKESEKDDDQR